jgi:hypothetical protein
MKKLVLFSTLALMAFAVKAQTTPEINKIVEFKNAEYNAGQTLTGKAVEFVVEAKNISKDTIVLITAKAGCGCTTPNFTPNQKLAPGETGKVSISFNGSATGPYTKFTDIIFDKGLIRRVTLTGEGVAVLPAQVPDAATAKGKTDKN